MEKLAKVANIEPTLVRVPRDVIAQARAGDAMDEPYISANITTCRPSRRISGRSRRVFKMKLTPFEVGLKEMYKWYPRNHKSRTASFEFDEKLLALAKTGSPASV